jgi:molecular chaperone DnaK
LTKASAKLDVLGPEDREEIIDLIEAIRDARASGDDASLDGSRKQLEDLLFYLET